MKYFIRSAWNKNDVIYYQIYSNNEEEHGKVIHLVAKVYDQEEALKILTLLNWGANNPNWKWKGDILPTAVDNEDKKEE